MMDDIPPQVLAQSPVRGKKGSYKGRSMVTTGDISMVNRIRSLRECDSLLESKATRLTEKTIYLALEKDDTTALKMCMDRIMPVPKERPVEMRVDQLDTVEDTLNAMKNIIQQMARGEINLSESRMAVDVLKDMRNMLMESIELKELQERSHVLENRLQYLEGSGEPIIEEGE